MPEEWVPIRALADRRGVTPDAIQKQLKRGRLDLPWRRTNTGRLEILVDLDTLPPMPEPDTAPVVAALEERIEELQSTIQRVILERDAERAWLEHERAARHEDAARHAEQLATQASEMARGLAAEAAKAGAAQQETESLRAELAALRRRGFLDRLLNRS
jgi:hypothetical protein